VKPSFEEVKAAFILAFPDFQTDHYWITEPNRHVTRYIFEVLTRDISKLSELLGAYGVNISELEHAPTWAYAEVEPDQFRNHTQPRDADDAGSVTITSALLPTGVK
jgi:hypothetical protein